MKPKLKFLHHEGATGVAIVMSRLSLEAFRCVLNPRRTLLCVQPVNGAYCSRCGKFTSVKEPPTQ